MSIKPVDFQVAIPRTTEASKIGSNDANRNAAAQQQAADSIQHKAEDSTKQVYSRSKAEDARINEKQKENGRGGKKSGGGTANSGEEQEKEQKKDQSKEHRTSIIDIKI